LVDEFTETITLVDFNLSFMKNKRKKSKTKSSLVEPRHKKEIKDKNDDLKKLKTSRKSSWKKFTSSNEKTDIKSV